MTSPKIKLNGTKTLEPVVKSGAAQISSLEHLLPRIMTQVSGSCSPSRVQQRQHNFSNRR